MESISRNHPRNLGAQELGRDATCVWDDCADEPHTELAAPLCMDHAKKLTVQVMLLTSNKISHVSKRMDNKTEAAHKPDKLTRATPHGLVYFIQFADRIKIGFTTDLDNRLKNLPHDRILALVPGTVSTEKQFHNMFKDLRITGEWFAMHRKLLDYIGTIPKHEQLAA